MATSKPRITITLSLRQHQVLRALSKTSGQSMSSVITELLETSLPVLERMAATFQAIKKAKDQERVRIAQTLDDAQSAFEPLAMAVVDQLDMFLGRVEGAIVGAPPQPRSDCGGVDIASSTAPNSPPTNRGVTPTGPKRRKPAPANASRAVSEKQKISKSAKKSGMQPS